jgi:alanyl-tRNA synthetase
VRRQPRQPDREIEHSALTGEGSAAAGIRRIESVTGLGAAHLMLEASAAWKVRHPSWARRRANCRAVSKPFSGPASLRLQASDLRRELAVSDFENKLGHLTEVDGIPVLSAAIKHANTETLRELADRFRDRNKSGVVALGAIVDDKPQLIVAVTDDLTQRGIHAGKIIGEVARMVGGGGGGRPNMAQAAARTQPSGRSARPRP